MVKTESMPKKGPEKVKVLRSVFGTKTDFDPITKPSKSLKAKLGSKTGSASNEASLLI